MSSRRTRKKQRRADASDLDREKLQGIVLNAENLIPSAVQDAPKADLLGEMVAAGAKKALRGLGIPSHRQDYDDLFQVGCEGILKKIHTWRGDGEFIPWAGTIARNAILDYSKRENWHHRHRSISFSTGDSIEERDPLRCIPSASTTPLTSLVRGAYEALSEADKGLVALLMQEGTIASVVEELQKRGRFCTNYQVRAWLESLQSFFIAADGKCPEM
jgi:RNA polymerase sigma factor (sigma-70 family)